jgi:hypothetical protein
MKDVKFPVEHQGWDYYKAFHAFCMFDGFRAQRDQYGGPPSPIVLFDTGELICTQASPSPNQRGSYHSIGVSLTTSKNEMLYLPDGRPVVHAWLDDGGMQYLLHDWESKRVVRLDGKHRRAPGAPNFYGNKAEAGSPLTPGIPMRFQYMCRAYIPGPGLPPIAHEKIKLTIPTAKAGFTKDELEHIQMIVHTGQAAMKLTDHEAVHTKAKSAADPDVLLKCQTWQDVPPSMLPALLNGAPTRILMCDYLLTEKP